MQSVVAVYLILFKDNSYNDRLIEKITQKNIKLGAGKKKYLRSQQE